MSYLITDLLRNRVDWICTDITAPANFSGNGVIRAIWVDDENKVHYLVEKNSDHTLAIIDHSGWMISILTNN